MLTEAELTAAFSKLKKFTFKDIAETMQQAAREKRLRGQ